MAVWNYDNAAHLLRRTAFGGTPEQIDSFFRAHSSVEEAVGNLLSFRTKKSRPPRGGRDEREAVRKQQTWWLRRMLAAKRPGDALRENLVLFWHNHLASGHSKQPQTSYMAAQNRLFRINARGNFRNLIREFNRDAANLYYLDGIINYASSDGINVNANENFAREIMELFTLGVKQVAADGSDDPALPNYSEADVHNLARACTGWVEVDRKGVGQWVQDAWDGGLYDDDGDGQPDPMTIFGVTRSDFRIDEAVAGAPNDVLELILSRRDWQGQSVAGVFLARKFWTWFAYPPPEAGMKSMLNGFAGVFETSGWNVTELLRAMFTHDAFYSDSAKSRTIRNPVDFVVQSLRAFRIRGNAKYVGDARHLLAEMVADMGMELFEPPNVAGWPGGQRWITTGTLLNRIAFARYLSESDFGSMRLRLKNIKSLPLGDAAADPAVVVDVILRQLGLDSGPSALSAAQRDILVDFANGGNPAATLDLSDEYTADAINIVRGVIGLALQSAEYQVV